MKFSKSLIVAAFLGTVTLEEVAGVARHHHHHSYVQTSADPVAAAADAELAGEAGAESPAEAAAEAKEAAKEKMPTAEDVKKEAAAVLKPKAADSSTQAQLAWAESRAADAAEAASVA